ncbi:MAG: GNAT family N-acetyltransferase [Candidatus Binataceae bacterium]
MVADVSPPVIDARNYAAEEVLLGGRMIHIRSIRPDDKARLLEHFAGLGAQTRYFRFFGYKRELTGQDLARYTELDFTRHVGLAATVWLIGRERFIGVGRYIRKEIPSRADLALAVLDKYQGEGIGPLLLRHLAYVAHTNGIAQFEADVLGDNSRMLAVLRKSRCIIDHANSAGIIHFTLQCPGVVPSRVGRGDLNRAGRRAHDLAMPAERRTQQ